MVWRLSLRPYNHLIRENAEDGYLRQTDRERERARRSARKLHVGCYTPTAQHDTITATPGIRTNVAASLKQGSMRCRQRVAWPCSGRSARNVLAHCSCVRQNGVGEMFLPYSVYGQQCSHVLADCTSCLFWPVGKRGRHGQAVELDHHLQASHGQHTCVIVIRLSRHDLPLTS